MAAAQQVQKQQLDAVSKKKVVAEVRELLQGQKVEQAWVEAALKQAEQRLEPLAAGTQVAAGKDKIDVGGIQCSRLKCHAEFLFPEIGKFSGDAIGLFTPGGAGFVPNFDLYLCASLEELLSLTSFFLIRIGPVADNSVFMAFFATKPGADIEPHLLAVLQTHLACTMTGNPGAGMGLGSWSPRIKA